MAARFVEYVCAQAGFTTTAAPGGADYGIHISVQTFDASVRVALQSLGFHRSTVDGGHVFLHAPTDTVVLFPAKTLHVKPQRIAALRQILTGRDVTIPRGFDEAFGLVSSVSSVA